MRVLLAACALTLLAGCGGEPGRGATPATSSPSQTTDALGPTCQRVADSLPEYADSYNPQKLGVFMRDLSGLANRGDAATKAALRPLVAPVNNLAASPTPQHHEEFLRAVEAFADRCRAAGSTALD